VGIQRPDGPYSVEMTAGPAWPGADENTYRDRADELRTTLRSLTSTTEQWEQQRATLFNGDLVWSGEAATAAATEVDKRTAAMHTLQDQLRAAATQADTTATVIGAVKTQITENVETTQKIIDQINNTPAATTEQKSAAIQQVVTTTHATNTAAVAAGAAQLGAAPPATPLNFRPTNTAPPQAPPPKKDKLDPPETDNPVENKKWWDSLSPVEKEAAYERNHFIGNLPGMPFVDRDFYNRQHLDGLQQQNDSELARLRAAHPDWAEGKNTGWRIPPRDFKDWKAQWDSANHAHDGYKAVGDSLTSSDLTSSDGVPRYLSFIDDRGHAAVSIGNPDTAKRTATFVPGTGQDLAAFGGSSLKSEKMFDAALQADRSLSKTDVAVTTWMGYDRPMDLLQAASPDRAINGGAALATYLDGMHASHVGPAAIDTVIGHSYGSTLVGGAATGGNHLAADNVIAVGSPGMLAQHASDLSLETGAHVFASRAENDVIGVVTYATLGPDPMARQFGGIPFEAAPGPASSPLGLPSVAAHSSYWDEGKPALINMGRIIAGQLTVTPPTFTP
jgi:hypothetical protein